MSIIAEPTGMIKIPETPAIYGSYINPSAYIPQALSAADLGERLSSFDPNLLSSRGLEVLPEIPKEMLHRVNCMPTATMVAINELTGVDHFSFQDKSKLTLSDLYTAGVLAHVNDEKEGENVTRKGFPSFHYKTGEMYHPFAIALARRFGLEGALVTEFDDISFLKKLLDAGCVSIVSVDNLFIRDVAAPQAKLEMTGIAKHAEVIHGYDLSTEEFIYSDVFDMRDEKSWDGRNLKAAPERINSYLTCPRRNDTGTRAVVLYNPVKTHSQVLEQYIPEKAKIDLAPRNPILDYKPELTLSEWNAEIEDLWKQGSLAQWDLVDQLQHKH